MNITDNKQILEKLKGRIKKYSVRLVFNINKDDKIIEIKKFADFLSSLGYYVYVDFDRNEMVAIKKAKKYR